MNRYLIAALLPLYFPLHANVVTVDSSYRGRFGNQLFMYFRAKSIAYQLDLPFLYKPFPYSDQLVLHKVEKNSTIFTGKKRRVVKVPAKMSLDQIKSLVKRNNSSLFVVQYAYDISKYIPDDTFIAEMRRLIAPVRPLNVLKLPEDRCSIAVHVRSGRGYDQKHDFIGMPQLFLPLSYYRQGLESIADLVGDMPLLVHLFTDDPNPEEIINNLKSALHGRDVHYVYRASENKHDQNVLEDFFSMMRFDCLIRSGSTFAQVIDMLGDHVIVVSPSREIPSPRSSVEGLCVSVHSQKERAHVLGLRKDCFFAIPKKYYT